jgi:hypothetical protein
MAKYAQPSVDVNSQGAMRQCIKSNSEEKVVDINAYRWAEKGMVNTPDDTINLGKDGGRKKKKKSPSENNSGQDASDKDEYIEAIRLWVSSVRLDEAMKREDLAQLEGIQRLIVLSRGLLPNIIRLCRRAKRADTRLGVLAIIHLCADNDDGLCRLSIVRFAQLLCRKEESIRDAILDLERGGEVHVEHSVNGNSYWPRIPTRVAHVNPSVGWIVDGLSDKPRTVGRPARKRTPLTRGVLSEFGDDPKPLGTERPQRKDGVLNEQLGVLQKGNTPPLRGEMHPPYAGTYTAKLNCSEEEITNKGDRSRCGNTREGISRPGCTDETGNGEVL